VLRALLERVPDGQAAFSFNPLWYDRPAIHVFSPSSGRALFAKFAPGAEGRPRFLREREVIRALQSLPQLRGTVSRTSDFVESHLGSALITDALQGDPPPLYLTDPMRAWLERCRLSGSLALRESELVQALIEDVCGMPDEAVGREVAARVLRAVGAQEVPLTLVHGDFVPWNMLLGDGEPRVFDWERASFSGIPLWDQLYFQLQVGLIKQSWCQTDVLRWAEGVGGPMAVPYGRTYVRACCLLVMLKLLVINVREAGDVRRASSLRDAMATLSRRWLMA